MFVDSTFSLHCAVQAFAAGSIACPNLFYQDRELERSKCLQYLEMLRLEDGRQGSRSTSDGAGGLSNHARRRIIAGLRSLITSSLGQITHLR